MNSLFLRFGVGCVLGVVGLLVMSVLPPTQFLKDLYTLLSWPAHLLARSQIEEQNPAAVLVIMAWWAILGGAIGLLTVPIERFIRWVICHR